MGKKDKKYDERADFENPFAAAFGGPKNPPPPIEDEIERDLASSALTVTVSSKGRRGKTVCIVDGIPIGHRQELEKKIKTRLGTGATWEDASLIVMGDQRTRLIDLLRDLGATDVS